LFTTHILPTHSFSLRRFVYPLRLRVTARLFPHRALHHAHLALPHPTLVPHTTPAPLPFHPHAATGLHTTHCTLPPHRLPAHTRGLGLHAGFAHRSTLWFFGLRFALCSLQFCHAHLHTVVFVGSPVGLPGFYTRYGSSPCSSHYGSVPGSCRLRGLLVWFGLVCYPIGFKSLVLHTQFYGLVVVPPAFPFSSAPVWLFTHTLLVCTLHLRFTVLPHTHFTHRATHTHGLPQRATRLHCHTAHWLRSHTTVYPTLHTRFTLPLAAWTPHIHTATGQVRKLPLPRTRHAHTTRAAAPLLKAPWFSHAHLVTLPTYPLVARHTHTHTYYLPTRLKHTAHHYTHTHTHLFYHTTFPHTHTPHTHFAHTLGFGCTHTHTFSHHVLHHTHTPFTTRLPVAHTFCTPHNCSRLVWRLMLLM